LAQQWLVGLEIAFQFEISRNKSSSTTIASMRLELVDHFGVHCCAAACQVEFWRKGPSHQQEEQEQDWLWHGRQQDPVDTSAAAVAGSGGMMSEDIARWADTTAGAGGAVSLLPEAWLHVQQQFWSLARF
jgi:hypothetical protein